MAIAISSTAVIPRSMRAITNSISKRKGSRLKQAATVALCMPARLCCNWRKRIKAHCAFLWSTLSMHRALSIAV
ncbi:Uncharacterised protein [Vibrio cholerae]|nr:Uncharacterised protein [Vibrio cholerae]